MIFSDFEYASKRKQTRRERSSPRWIKSCMDRSAGPDRAFLPQGRCGRKPYPLETMLRIHLLQNWFSLSDTAIEDALYEIMPMRQFTRLTSSAPIPKDTTNMNFRHLLESINWPLRSSRSSMVICKKKACPTLGHHRRCHHHSCPQFDQERGRQERCQAASDQER